MKAKVTEVPRSHFATAGGSFNGDFNIAAWLSVSDHCGRIALFLRAIGPDGCERSIVVDEVLSSPSGAVLLANRVHVETDFTLNVLEVWLDACGEGNVRVDELYAEIAAPAAVSKARLTAAG